MKPITNPVKRVKKGNGSFKIYMKGIPVKSKASLKECVNCRQNGYCKFCGEPCRYCSKKVVNKGKKKEFYDCFYCLRGRFTEKELLEHENNNHIVAKKYWIFKKDSLWLIDVSGLIPKIIRKWNGNKLEVLEKKRNE